MDENNHRLSRAYPSGWPFWHGSLYRVFFCFLMSKSKTDSIPTNSRSNPCWRYIELKLKQNRSGHYVVNGTINGQPVVYLLDTGATTVTIPGHLANRLNLVPGYPQTVSTANGNRTVYRTTAEILTIDKIMLYNVPANLNDGMTGDYILLGMSALKQLDFKQSDGWLYLSQSN